MFYLKNKCPSHQKDVELWKVNFLFFYDNFIVL